MEGFKCNPKMASELPKFKAGGYVTKKELVAYEKKEDRAEEKKDIAEDKKIAKKAIAQHESAQHKGEPKTEIKLKKGGRSKKETGKVRKYKAGKSVQPFFNEEPDMGSAPPPPPKAKPKKKLPVQETAPGAVSDAERQKVMQMFEGGPQAYAPGGSVTDPIMRTGRAGLGTALNTGALGAAGPMGAARNVPVSPQEADVLRGLEAVGSYCRGGKASK